MRYTTQRKTADLATGGFLKRKQCFAMVPKAGLEPARCHQRGILNPLRLPFRHLGMGRFLSLLLPKVQRQNQCFMKKICHRPHAHEVES